MSEETKKTAPAAEAEQQPAAAPEATAEQAAPAQEPAAEEAADPKDDKKKDGGWFNKKAREMDAVKAKLDAAEKNAAQAKDQLLRMAAEYIRGTLIPLMPQRGKTAGSLTVGCPCGITFCCRKNIRCPTTMTRQTPLLPSKSTVRMMQPSLTAA